MAGLSLRPRTSVMFMGAVLKISSPRAMLACCGLALFLQAWNSVKTAGLNGDALGILAEAHR